MYVFDVDTGTEQRADVDGNGRPTADIGSHASISGDGRYVVFQATGQGMLVPPQQPEPARPIPDMSFCRQADVIPIRC